ncbi:unnamed protein product [Clavelina lepadiformis]|uniref:Uncharacterized protein n=1 Tax=Clavelina lepadiformis TaxID=159417 RepID=A0ABP0GLW9_CLALP
MQGGHHSPVISNKSPPLLSRNGTHFGFGTERNFYRQLWQQILVVFRKNCYKRSWSPVLEGPVCSMSKSTERPQHSRSDRNIQLCQSPTPCRSEAVVQLLGPVIAKWNSDASRFQDGGNFTARWHHSFE